MYSFLLVLSQANPHHHLGFLPHDYNHQSIEPEILPEQLPNLISTNTLETQLKHWDRLSNRTPWELLRDDGYGTSLAR